MRGSEGCNCPCFLLHLLSVDRDATLKPARYIAANVKRHSWHNFS